MCTYAASIAATVLMLLNKRWSKLEGLAAVCIPFSIAAAASYLSHLEQGVPSTRVFLIYVATIAMTAMYYRVRSLLVYAVLLNVLIAGFFMLDPVGLMGSGYSGDDFRARLVCVDLSFFIFYFLAKWGNGYVQSALAKEQDAQILVDQLKNTMQAIEKNTFVLNQSVDKSYVFLETIKESGSQTAAAVDRIAEGINEQAESTGRIVQMTDDIAASVEGTRRISQETVRISSHMKSAVRTNAQGISQMTREMDTVAQAIRAAMNNVEELRESMGRITSSLADITEIARQTNLLALNAAIEAARAGESGRGFAIVAGEIRKLAETSANTARDIAAVVNEVQSRTAVTLDRVSMGHEAVESGNRVVLQVADQFLALESSSWEINKRIEEEEELVEHVASVFFEIKRQLEVISSVTVEHAAASQEILASAEEQNQKMIQVSGEMKEIHKGSAELNGLLHRNVHSAAG
jgi:methyl-accepting chemotaxis protein